MLSGWIWVGVGVGVTVGVGLGEGVAVRVAVDGGVDGLDAAVGEVADGASATGVGFPTGRFPLHAARASTASEMTAKVANRCQRRAVRRAPMVFGIASWIAINSCTAGRKPRFSEEPRPLVASSLRAFGQDQRQDDLLAVAQDRDVDGLARRSVENHVGVEVGEVADGCFV